MLHDNKDKRISLRISEKDFEYLAIVAYMALKISEAKGDVKLEDFKALLNDKL